MPNINIALLFLRVILIALLLSGCATQRTVTGAYKPDDWQRHQEKLAALDHWRLQGRIAIRLEKEGWSATLSWRQERGNYSLRLMAPLGRGTYELTMDAGVITLRTADNRLLHAEDAETLLQQNLGWHVPVSGLIYWIRGLPEPGVKMDTLLIDDHGRISDLAQAGWKVSYLSYMTSQGYELPEKLTMQHDQLRLRVVIHAWDISS